MIVVCKIQPQTSFCFSRYLTPSFLNPASGDLTGRFLGTEFDRIRLATWWTITEQLSPNMPEAGKVQPRYSTIPTSLGAHSLCDTSETCRLKCALQDVRRHVDYCLWLQDTLPWKPARLNGQCCEPWWTVNRLASPSTWA